MLQQAGVHTLYTPLRLDVADALQLRDHLVQRITARTTASAWRFRIERPILGLELQIFDHECAVRGMFDPLL